MLTIQSLTKTSLTRMSGYDPQTTAELLRAELYLAETKAWDALSRYKFQMFGYWAGVWVHLNRIGGFKRPNPWKAVVQMARKAVPR